MRELRRMQDTVRGELEQVSGILDFAPRLTRAAATEVHPRSSRSPDPDAVPADTAGGNLVGRARAVSRWGPGSVTPATA